MISNGQYSRSERTIRPFDLDERWHDPQIEDVKYLKDAAEWLRWDYPEQSTMLYSKAILFGLKILRQNSSEQTNVFLGEAAMADITNCMIEFGAQIQDIDPEWASYWFEEAAKLGNNDAFCYFIELWAEKDQSRATKLTEQILATSDPELIHDSACQLKNVNINVAIDMLRIASELGSPDAAYELAKLRIKQTTRNKEEAIRLYELAIKRGNSHALIDLAEMLEKEDPSRAADLYDLLFPDWSYENKEKGMRKTDEALAILDNDDDNLNPNDTDYISPLEMSILITKMRIKNDLW